MCIPVRRLVRRLGTEELLATAPATTTATLGNGDHGRLHGNPATTPSQHPAAMENGTRAGTEMAPGGGDGEVAGRDEMTRWRRPAARGDPTPPRVSVEGV